MSQVLAREAERIAEAIKGLPIPEKDTAGKAIKEFRFVNVVVKQKIRCFITRELTESRRIIVCEKKVPIDVLVFGWKEGQYHLDQGKITFYGKNDPIIIYDEKY